MSKRVRLEALRSSSLEGDARMDGNSGALLAIPMEHHEIHEGHHFTFSVSDPDIDADETLEFLLTTPAEDEGHIHLFGDAYGALHTLVELFEDATHAASEAQTAYNNNRNSENEPGLAIATHDAGGEDGTRIFVSEFGIDTGGFFNRATGGGSVRADSEWVLKPASKYLIRVTSKTANNVVSLSLVWYEHSPTYE